MRARAKGPFEVKITPQANDAPAEGSTLGRMSISKQYRGDLVGIGVGEMLTAGTAVAGSAAYVAVERVTGTLAGRAGTFALQHAGTMTRGEPHLLITVVPDSGTGELLGLDGTMLITIADGAHSYELDYSIAGTR